MLMRRRWWLRWGPAVTVCAFCATFPLATWWAAEHSSRPPLDYPAVSGTYHDTQPKPGKVQQEEPVWQATVHDPVALWTFFLVIFTGVLACVSMRQFKYLRRADQTARIAANAAKSSADALPAIERAYVFLKVEGFTLEQTVAAMHNYRMSDTKADPATVFMRFENHGRTPAAIQKFSAGLFRGRDFPETMPDKPVTWKTQWEKVIPAGKIIPVNSPITVDDSERVTGRDFDSWEKQEWFWFFFGSVLYEDVMGKERVTSFLWRYGKGEDFAEWGGKKYNYRT